MFFKKNNFIAFFIFSFIFLSLFFPVFSLAAGLSGPLVICADINNCNFCDLLQTAKNILDFSIQLAFILVVAYTVWGGLQIMVSGAFESLYSKGKKLITNAAIGLVIILVSWGFVDQLIRVMVGGSIFQGNFSGWVWNEIPCDLNKVDLPAISNSGSGTVTPGGGGFSGGQELCNNPAKLAEKYGVPYPVKNSFDIDAIIGCVNGSLNKMIDQNQIYTSDRDHPLCNYTRGEKICGDCSHKVYSCHYGGMAGHMGVLAVDFNAAVGISESKLNDEINKIARAGDCGISISNVIFEDDHTHISAPSCNSKY